MPAGRVGAVSTPRGCTGRHGLLRLLGDSVKWDESGCRGKIEDDTPGDADVASVHSRVHVRLRISAAIPTPAKCPWTPSSKGAFAHQWTLVLSSGFGRIRTK